MSHYEQYRDIRPRLANTQQELTDKSLLLVNTALEVFPPFVENSCGRSGVEVAPHDRDVRIRMELEGGFFFAHGPDPQAEGQEPLVKTLLATKKQDETYDVVRNTYSRADARLLLSTHLFRVATAELDPDLLFINGGEPLHRRTHQAGWTVRLWKGLERSTCMIVPLGDNTDEVHRTTLRPSERYIRPFSTHRIANHRQQEAIDFMAGHAGLR